jgi:hypothetical protein
MSRKNPKFRIKKRMSLTNQRIEPENQVAGE